MPPKAPELQILDGVYLVDEHQRERFLAEVAELDQRPGLQTRCTGPWPPFHFARIVLSEPFSVAADE
jgi:hypothetical protein